MSIIKEHEYSVIGSPSADKNWGCRSGPTNNRLSKDLLSISFEMNSKQLFSQADKILWEDWDTIGVNDMGSASNKYRGYVPSIVNLIEQNADEIKFMKLLHQHANVNMGLSTELGHHRLVAGKLKELSR